MEEVHHTLNKIDPTGSEKVQLNAASALFLAEAAKDTIIRLEEGMDEKTTSEKVGQQYLQAKLLKITQIKVLKQWSASLENYANAFSV